LETCSAEHFLHGDFRVSTIACFCFCCGVACGFDSSPFSVPKAQDSVKTFGPADPKAHPM